MGALQGTVSGCILRVSKHTCFPSLQSLFREDPGLARAFAHKVKMRSSSKPVPRKLAACEQVLAEIPWLEH